MIKLVLRHSPDSPTIILQAPLARILQQMIQAGWDKIFSDTDLIQAVRWKFPRYWPHSSIILYKLGLGNSLPIIRGRLMLELCIRDLMIDIFVTSLWLPHSIGPVSAFQQCITYHCDQLIGRSNPSYKEEILTQRQVNFTLSPGQKH
jgi:hypothetical protein